MSSVRTSQLLRSAPYFPVADLEQSAAHYERVLGFHCEYSGGTPPQFAILSRDGLAIMLRVVPTPERISPNEKQGGTWDAFFWVRDARALHAELRGHRLRTDRPERVSNGRVRGARSRGICPGVWAGAATAGLPADLRKDASRGQVSSRPSCRSAIRSSSPTRTKYLSAAGPQRDEHDRVGCAGRLLN